MSRIESTTEKEPVSECCGFEFALCKEGNHQCKDLASPDQDCWHCGNCWERWTCEGCSDQAVATLNDFKLCADCWQDSWENERPDISWNGDY